MKKRQLRSFEIKERNCKEKLGIVRRYWAKYFDADRTVQSLTSRELDDFLLSLRRDKGLAADTVNKTMTAGNMAFEFLIKEGLLEKNPLVGVERFRVQARKRGIPTETEMRQLMALDWDWTDSAYKLAFKVSDQPIWPSSFEDDFYMAMQKIGISEEQRKERNIVFHSLRHYCATQIAQRTSLEIAMKILGHRTEEMTRLYSEHETKVKLDNAKEVLSQGWKILTA